MSLLAALLATALSSPATAGVACQLGPSSSSYSPAYDIAPTPQASRDMSAVASALCGSGCGTVSFVANPTVPNALTYTVQPGVSKISYSPAFMNGVWQSYGHNAAVGIFAHELGHHLDLMQTSSWMDSSWGRELRADAWAGCAMARLGMSPTNMAAALQAIAAYPSPSHPAWTDRIPALQAGYTQCGGVGSLPRF